MVASLKIIRKFDQKIIRGVHLSGQKSYKSNKSDRINNKRDLNDLKDLKDFSPKETERNIFIIFEINFLKILSEAT